VKTPQKNNEKLRKFIEIAHRYSFFKPNSFDFDHSFIDAVDMTMAIVIDVLNEEETNPNAVWMFLYGHGDSFAFARADLLDEIGTGFSDEAESAERNRVYSALLAQSSEAKYD
jgi:hypothetical protein